MSFFMRISEKRQSLCVQTVNALDSYQDDWNYNIVLKEFSTSLKDDTVEVIMSYNDILERIQNQDD